MQKRLSMNVGEFLSLQPESTVARRMFRGYLFSRAMLDDDGQQVELLLLETCDRHPIGGVDERDWVACRLRFAKAAVRDALEDRKRTLKSRSYTRRKAAGLTMIVATPVGPSRPALALRGGNQDRDRAIFMAVANGETMASVASALGISRTRVGDIVAKSHRLYERHRRHYEALGEDLWQVDPEAAGALALIQNRKRLAQLARAQTSARV